MRFYVFIWLKKYTSMPSVVNFRKKFENCSPINIFEFFEADKVLDGESNFGIFPQIDYFQKIILCIYTSANSEIST